MLGITQLLKVVVMLIASFTASIAGVYIHFINHCQPDHSDLGYTVTGLLIVLIGGIATLSGSIVGAFVIKILTSVCGGNHEGQRRLW